MAKVSDEAKRNAALALKEYGILKFGQFKLKTGIISPYYIDMRIVQSFPKAFHTIANVYAELIQDLPEDIFLAGIPEAGIPLATSVGFVTNRPLIQPRAKVKAHGIGKLIEGEWKPGDKVAIVDDVIDKGDSKIEAIETFKTCELEVVGFYLIFDREVGGKEAVEKAGYKVEAALTITEALAILKEENKIDSAKIDEIMAFTESRRQ